jgi:hypothetical protein
LRQVCSQSLIATRLPIEEAHQSASMTMIELIISPIVVFTAYPLHQLFIRKRREGF